MSPRCPSTHTVKGQTKQCGLKSGHKGVHESAAWKWRDEDADRAKGKV